MLEGARRARASSFFSHRLWHFWGAKKDRTSETKNKNVKIFWAPKRPKGTKTQQKSKNFLDPEGAKQYKTHNRKFKVWGAQKGPRSSWGRKEAGANYFAP